MLFASRLLSVALVLKVTSKDPREGGYNIPSDSKLRNYDCDRCPSSTYESCPLPVREHCDPSGWFYLNEQDGTYHFELENMNDDWRTFHVKCQQGSRCLDSSPPSNCGWATCEEVLQLNVSLPCLHTWRDLAQMFGGDESCDYDRQVSDVCHEACQQCQGIRQHLYHLLLVSI